MEITQKKLSDEVSLFTISNGWMSFSAMNFGCAVTNLYVPDKNNNLTDIVLGFDDLEGYKNGKGSLGSIVGRFANRIKNSEFTLDGTTYKLDKNGRDSCLHGGFNRIEKMVWQASTFQEENKAGVIFRKKSPEEEQKFPGNIEIEVSYILNNKNQLFWNYKVTTDKATPINITNHSYFNLAGKGNILNHELILDYGKVLEVTDKLLPTGKILSTEGTVFDFTQKKKVGADIHNVNENIGGYDHCFVTKAYETKQIDNVGTVYEESTGISMNIKTNQPGIQIYTGNFLDGNIGKGNTPYKKHDGICFETQQFPDAPNQPNFPNCILRPGDIYDSQTIFEFCIK